MMRRFVRSTIANATVTSGDSVALIVDPILLAAAALQPYEEVELVHHATGERFTTFVQAGTEGSGEVRVHRIRTGDVVTILSWGGLHDGQPLEHRVTVVTVDAANTVVAVEQTGAS